MYYVVYETNGEETREKKSDYQACKSYLYYVEQMDVKNIRILNPDGDVVYIGDM